MTGADLVLSVTRVVHVISNEFNHHQYCRRLFYWNCFFSSRRKRKLKQYPFLYNPAYILNSMNVALLTSYIKLPIFFHSKTQTVKLKPISNTAWLMTSGFSIDARCEEKTDAVYRTMRFRICWWVGQLLCCKYEVQQWMIIRLISCYYSLLFVKISNSINNFRRKWWLKYILSKLMDLSYKILRLVYFNISMANIYTLNWRSPLNYWVVNTSF